MSFLAQVSYTGNGSTTQYSITFPYIDVTHVKAYLNGTLTSAYTISSSTLTFTTAPANGVVIRIERETPNNNRLVDFTDGSVLTESDLDRSADQNFYIAQEITDDSASKLGLDTDDKYDANNKVIKNLANPVNNNDAVNKTYLENTWLSPANKSALTTVNANIANINAVNSNASNINSAVANQANINTVATNIGSVNTVATDIAKVITVANDLAEAVSEVETVADDLNEATSEIDTVANNITNVNTVGTNIANVNTVAGISANVTTVAGNNANVTTVAGISGDVTTVAGISTDVSAVENISANVTTVAGIDSDVTTVAGIASAVVAVSSNSTNINAVNANSTNINTVSGNNTNINTVAGNNANISTVAGISGNVTTVAGISANVTAVAGDATDIGTVATNLTGTNTIGTVAGSIANVNNVGGSIANVNTVATNIASVNNFGEVYRISATAPITSLNSGDLYFDTSTNILNVYGASGWQNAGSSVNGTSQRYNYTATASQTTFTGADNGGNTLTYDAGYIDVYLNGVKLLNGTDVTVSSGTSVVLATGATAGDIVDIVAYGTFSVASLNADNLDSGTVPTARISGAYTGITQTGTLASFASTGIDDNATSTAITISSGQNVGIGTSSPNDTLHINGNVFIEGSSPEITFETTNPSHYNWQIAVQENVADALEISVGSADSDASNDTFSPVAVFKNSGKVGIGTSSPNSRLEVLDSSATGIISRSTTTQATDTNKALRVRNNSDTDTFAVSYKGSVFLGSGTGIYFDGSTSGNNALDDYEEGEYNITATDSGGGATITLKSYTNRLRYTKIGSIVHVQGRVQADTVTGTYSGTLNINLPFASADLVDTGDSVGTVIGVYADYDSGASPACWVTEGSSLLEFRTSRYSNQVGNLTLGVNDYLVFQITYVTN
jgi:hypothetical protein